MHGTSQIPPRSPPDPPPLHPPPPDVGASLQGNAPYLAKLTNINGEILWDTSKPDGTPKKLLDISRLKKLGWESTINLEDGIKKTILSLYNEKL